ncbi:hypothetical protein ABN028_33140 [Actinopolymorpha sp. B17G11]|uniref:hypothetical protein n=1 Tax=Actinopolymorpha sp. B17G11 TaxID=3160861 RepID=UPI0032E402E0
MPDASVAEALSRRIDDLIAAGQSPAGYFYEPYGVDHGYNFTVTLPDLADLHRLTGHPGLVTMVEKFADWYCLVRVREPDDAGWIYFSALSARTISNSVGDYSQEPDRDVLATLLLDEVPTLAPYFTSAEARAAGRAEWVADPDPVPPLVKPDTSPRIVLHADLGESYPPETLRTTWIERLPYVERDSFTEMRSDPRGQDYLFVRRPSYYAGSWFGPRETGLVRSGPAFLWHPACGMFVHSRNDADGRAWATVLADGTSTASSSLTAGYFIGEPERGIAIPPERRLPGGGPLGVRYADPADLIRTDLVFTDVELRQRIEVAGQATQVIPLVVRTNDRLELADGTALSPGQSVDTTTAGVTIRRGAVSLRLSWDESHPISLAATTAAYFLDRSRSLHLLRVSFENTVEVRYVLA